MFELQNMMPSSPGRKIPRHRTVNTDCKITCYCHHGLQNNRLQNRGLQNSSLPSSRTALYQSTIAMDCRISYCYCHGLENAMTEEYNVATVKYWKIPNYHKQERKNNRLMLSRSQGWKIPCYYCHVQEYTMQPSWRSTDVWQLSCHYVQYCHHYRVCVEYDEDGQANYDDAVGNTARMVWRNLMPVRANRHWFGSPSCERFGILVTGSAFVTTTPSPPKKSNLYSPCLIFFSIYFVLYKYTVDSFESVSFNLIYFFWTEHLFCEVFSLTPHKLRQRSGNQLISMFM
jgi:hypothetical protein